MINLGIDVGNIFARVAGIDARGIVTVFADSGYSRERRTPVQISLAHDRCLVGHYCQDYATVRGDLAVLDKFKGALQATARDVVATDGSHWTPAMTTAIVIKKLTEEAQKAAHDEIGQVVIVVPLDFPDVARRAVKRACLLAGLSLGRLTLVAEPIAAAYARQKQNARRGSAVLFCDVGGGGVRAAVLRRGELGIIEVCCHHHLAAHGSTAIDDSLIALMVQCYRDQHGLDPTERSAGIIEFQRCVWELYTDLARASNQVFVKCWCIAGRPFRFIISRYHLEEMIHHHLDSQIVQCIAAVRAKNGNLAQDCDIVVAGGGFMFPKLRESLARAAGMPQEQITSEQADETIVVGAALMAGALARGEAVCVPEKNVLPYEIGILTRDSNSMDPVVKVVFDAGATIPLTTTTRIHLSRTDQSRLVIELVRRDSRGTKPFGRTSLALAGHRERSRTVTLEFACDEARFLTLRCSAASDQRYMFDCDAEPDSQLEPESERVLGMRLMSKP